jgi:MATE family multidrug resistance protein
MPTPSLRDWWRRPGGGRELLALAWPLIVSNGFSVAQLTLDRILLGQAGGEAVGAAMPAALLFWSLQNLFLHTANYATTFVAQYAGAGRPERVGPVVWQSLWFSVVGGIVFLGLVPLAGPLVALGGNTAELQALEAVFLRCLCFAALPNLLAASAGSFFTGRGESRVILVVNTCGLIVNGLLDYAWIFGRWGFPAWGIEGAGWATVCGSVTSAALSLALFLRPRYRKAFGTTAGWRFDPALFRRLLHFGLPNGLLVALDTFSFAAFTFLVGRLGPAELAATSIAFALNLLILLPVLGFGQAVEVLVGRRLGEGRPDLAERATWTGFTLAWLGLAAAAVAFVTVPEWLALPFRSDADPHSVAAFALVPLILRFVAVYSLFDAANLVFSFALRGAGDTRFVTVAALGLAWPVMVLPTWAAWRFDWGLAWAWGFASAYVILLAFTFLGRFRQGKWKTMRVIEPVEEEPV